MTQELATKAISPETLESVIIEGDLSKLSSQQRMDYYNAVCTSLGLNPLTKPFEYLRLSGKLVLYARRDCTEQLRKLYSISATITSRETVSGVYVVTAKASTPDGRTDESIGAVTIDNLKGENLANAMMKAETKAKRRVTLSLCGMGFLDETEVETIVGAKVVEVNPTTGELPEPEPARDKPQPNPAKNVITSLSTYNQGKKAPYVIGPRRMKWALQKYGITSEKVNDGLRELTPEQSLELSKWIADGTLAQQAIEAGVTEAKEEADA